MVPTLFHLGDLAIPTHDVFLVLGVGAALLVYGWQVRERGGHDPRLWQIAAGGLVLGAVFARISTAWRYLAATPEASLAGLWLYGGKSVLGGLAGAYLGVHLTKRLLGYRERTGDVFAPAVALGLAIGRIGCFLTEPIGRPTSLPWGITPDPAVDAAIPGCTTCTLGVPLHPSFLYEIVFHLVAFVVLVRYGPRLHAAGETFTLYLLAYGSFRFAVEFARDSVVMAVGLTGSQLFLLATLPLLLTHVVRQWRRGAYTRGAASPAPAGAATPPPADPARPER
jgi:phosphatidylglycerol---prolipoprotein diacylglyceryl transferase